jgi:hypothetical protein
MILLLSKRAEAVRLIAQGEASDKELADIEKLEQQIGPDPADILYSERTEDVISYQQKVMEIEADKDDFFYSLAGHKGETLESLSRKTAFEIMSFAERLTDELNGRH